MSRRRLILIVFALVILLPVGAATLLAFNVNSQVNDLFRLNAALQRSGYYMGDFEFKLLGLSWYLDKGQYLTAFEQLNRLHRQLETRSGLIRVPAFSSKEDEYNFYLNLQNPQTGAFIDASYPYCTYNEVTLNVLSNLEALARATNQPLRLKYRLRYLDDIDTPQKLDAFLDDVSHVGRIAASFPQTTFLFARSLAGFATPDDNVIERNGLYHFSAAWRRALLQWFYDNQDPDTGFWGPRTDGKRPLKPDLNNTASIIKAFVDSNGDNLHPDFPLRYRDRLFETTLEVLSIPMPDAEETDSIHEWNLQMGKGITMLTLYLWDGASREARMTAQGLIKHYLRTSFEKFYVAGDGAFSYYPSEAHASLDGTGSKLHDFRAIGFFSNRKQRQLWGPANVIDLGTFTTTALSKSDFDPLRNRLDVNSVRLYTSTPQTDYLEGVAAVFYPGNATVLDAMDLAPKAEQWVQSTSQTMGNWTSKEVLTQSLDALDLHWVPVYREQIPPDKADALLRRNHRIVAIGFDILQVPTYKVAFELAE